MRVFICLALSAGALLCCASAQAHPQPVRPKVVHHLAYKPANIVLVSGADLPSMPELQPFAPKLLDYQEPQEQKPTWPREAVQPELEYDATPLLAPPDYSATEAGR